MVLNRPIGVDALPQVAPALVEAHQEDLVDARDGAVEGKLAGHVIFLGRPRQDLDHEPRLLDPVLAAGDARDGKVRDAEVVVLARQHHSNAGMDAATRRQPCPDGGAEFGRQPGVWCTMWRVHDDDVAVDQLVAGVGAGRWNRAAMIASPPWASYRRPWRGPMPGEGCAGGRGRLSPRRMGPIPFVKMHGCGNDFVVLDGRRTPLALDEAAVRRIGDRHRGVGFDQLLLIEPASDADVALRFFNSDGSESGACGNATRCVARLLFDEGASGTIEITVRKRRLRAERLADGRVAGDMGAPELDWPGGPLADPCYTLEVPLDVAGLPRPVAVNMGNPHAVFF